MKLGIFSDIHGNWEAFKAVLKALKKEKVASRICLGDMVGYGADPNKCIRKVQKFATVTLAGNHDHAAMGLTDITHFNQYAQESVAWTAGQIKDKFKDYLKNLPFMHEMQDIRFVHATPQHPEQWNYVLSADQAQFVFETFTEQILFIGHSHNPLFFTQTGSAVDIRPPGPIQLIAGTRYIVNVGSVGQPRDGNPQACYCVCDLEQQTVDIRRVPYNVERAQKKIRNAGLPDYLADRIAKGR
jgi:putative phosphoesterase